MKRDTLGTLRARIAELEAERQIDRQRLWDLVRLERHSLFDSSAITPDEFALLAQDHPAVARLESYDECRMRLSEWRRRAEVAEAALRTIIEKLRHVQCAEPVCDGLIGAVLDVARGDRQMQNSGNPSRPSVSLEIDGKSGPRSLYLSIEGIYVDGRKGTSEDAGRWLDELGMRSRVLPKDDAEGTQACQENGVGQESKP